MAPSSRPTFLARRSPSSRTSRGPRGASNIRAGAWAGSSASPTARTSCGVMRARASCIRQASTCSTKRRSSPPSCRQPWQAWRCSARRRGRRGSTPSWLPTTRRSRSGAPSRLRRRRSRARQLSTSPMARASRCCGQSTTAGGRGTRAPSWASSSSRTASGGTRCSTRAGTRRGHTTSRIKARRSGGTWTRVRSRASGMAASGSRAAGRARETWSRCGRRAKWSTRCSRRRLPPSASRARGRRPRRSTPRSTRRWATRARAMSAPTRATLSARAC